MIDELRTGKAMVLGDVTLIPIEHCYLHSNTGDMGSSVLGLKELYAIVIRDPAGLRAFDAAATEMPVKSLIRVAPGLEAVLAPDV